MLTGIAGAAYVQVYGGALTGNVYMSADGSLANAERRFSWSYRR